MHPDWWGITDIVPEHELQKAWLLLHGKPVANWPCWFLVCLFFVELVASELTPLHGSSRAKLLLTLPLVYGLAWLATDNLPRKAAYLGIVENWWFLQEGMMALFFYICGKAIAVHGRILLPSSNTFTTIRIVGFLALLIFAQSHLFPDNRSSVNMSASAHGHWLWFPIAAIAGSLMMLNICNLIPSVRILSYIGQNTLPMIGLSGLFLSFFNPPLWQLLDEIDNPWMILILSFLVSLLSLASCIPIIALLNRFAPILIGRWK
jgi:fucose 4-O-acetylase-like acetyltransferase